MSEYISRAKLAKSNLANLVRLAKFLGLHGCACGVLSCRQGLEEKLIRELEIQSMKRHKESKQI